MTTQRLYGVRLPTISVARTAVDDWLVHVLLSDGRVYVFQTELWPSHLEHCNWLATRREAENEALLLAARNADPFAADVDPQAITSDKQLLELCGRACMAMSDADFARLVRH